MMNFIKIFLPTAIAFFLGISLTPFVTRFLHTHRLWKRAARRDGEAMSVAFQAVSNKDEEIHTPRIGGVLVWLATIGTALSIWIIGHYIAPSPLLAKLDFISRKQTWILIAVMAIGALWGLFDDLLSIFVPKEKFRNGLPGWYMTGGIVFFGLLTGTWFYYKLGMHSILIPFTHGTSIPLGIWFIPFFALVTFALFSSGVIDGIDGLAGGVLTAIYASYSAIAYFGNHVDIAVFCAVTAGSLLAFLWFNIPPARFYLGETGMLALLLPLVCVAFLTNTVLLLPIIALPLTVTALSSSIQIISKKYFHKKIFLIAPLHHHFEALGWSRPKVTMRYWIVSVIVGIVSIILSIIS
jgi:phospho-N-acetylmuramoyl-pentapeptide-transferase